MSRSSSKQAAQRSVMVAVCVSPPKEIETSFLQSGLSLGSAPMAAASNRRCETATMKSVATLTMPQAPKPVAKNVPSPEKKPDDGGAVEVVAGGVAEVVAGGGGGGC